MVSTLAENSKTFVYLFVNYFYKIKLLWLVNLRILHQKKVRLTPQLSIIHQLSSEMWSIHYASLSAMFNPLHNITIQELFKKHLCNQSNHYERRMISVTKGSHHVCYRQINTFRC